jgi:hypothetical protein
MLSRGGFCLGFFLGLFFFFTSKFFLSIRGLLKAISNKIVLGKKKIITSENYKLKISDLNAFQKLLSHELIHLNTYFERWSKDMPLVNSHSSYPASEPFPEAGQQSRGEHATLDVQAGHEPEKEGSKF